MSCRSRKDRNPNSSSCFRPAVPFFWNSTATPMFRRFSAGSFMQATGINPSELESGGSNEDFKKVRDPLDSHSLNVLQDTHCMPWSPLPRSSIPAAHPPLLSLTVQALAAVLALSTAAVLGGVALGGFAGTFLVYIFLLVPVLFLGIGSSSPGLISILVVIVTNLIEVRGLFSQA